MYSKNDIYPNSSSTLPTFDQTVPNETAVADVTSVAPNSTQKVAVNKNMIWGALAMLVGLMVMLHFLGGE